MVYLRITRREKIIRGNLCRLPSAVNTSKYGFSLDLGGKNGGVLSMRMQVILDSPFARPGSAPIGGGKKGEFRDWTNYLCDGVVPSTR